MIKIIKTEKIPIKLWLSDMEPKALEQAKHLAGLPFAFHHIAVMPDAHEGYGMPIGGILATEGVVIPNAVGVDIGCGMCALRTSLKELDKDTLKKILGEIRKAVPVGFAHQIKKQKEEHMPPRNKNLKIVETQFESALKQIGTLGGGNHFIEIQKGSDGYIWLMVHSGSRNIGKRVADHYNKLAVNNAKKWGSDIPKNWQLDFLPADSEEGRDYLEEMQFCVDFSFANRRLMMDNVMKIFQKYTDADFMLDELINIAHNYASFETHFGSQVWVHRKGATQARKGQLGIIPGSQGSKSYIVRGKGNPESFESCSHGAGRRMGRNQARRTLILEEEIAKLDQKGVLHAIRGKRDLDEAPSAYKDIDEVMENQKDLVEIVIELTPLAVVKG
jgi:tRNA-splicing ligase RtcB